MREYSDSYSMTSRSLWNYYRDKIHTDANNRVNNNKTVTSKSFEYKIKLRGSNPDDSNILEDLANALEAFLS